MPPRKRPRTYDHARTATAVRAQLAHVREAVRGLDEEKLDGPSGLGDWTVRELVVHIDFGAASVDKALALPEPASVEIALPDWPLATAAHAAENHDGVRERARGWGGTEELLGLLDGTAARLDVLLSEQPAGRRLSTRVGSMDFTDLLVTRALELVVHTDDLARATGADIPLDRQALAACTRLLADSLARKAPGGSTEVRVPPFAVVQCVEGPRHTRGTPPNVVETDAMTFVRLATGRADWAEAVATYKVIASGERADLGALLPLMG